MANYSDIKKELLELSDNGIEVAVEKFNLMSIEEFFRDLSNVGNKELSVLIDAYLMM